MSCGLLQNSLASDETLGATCFHFEQVITTWYLSSNHNNKRKMYRNHGINFQEVAIGEALLKTKAETCGLNTTGVETLPFLIFPLKY